MNGRCDWTPCDEPVVLRVHRFDVTAERCRTHGAQLALVAHANLDGTWTVIEDTAFKESA